MPEKLIFLFPILDLFPELVMMIIMNSEFDWFMISMPVFAIAVFAIVMVGSMENQPKFLEGALTKKVLGIVFVGMFGAGVVISLFYMLLRFFELLANY